jgi:2-polyprenyl-3-methyl-5-hydroxy-6-metoxy-1,4-benzoquinol methylase
MSRVNNVIEYYSHTSVDAAYSRWGLGEKALHYAFFEPEFRVVDNSTQPESIVPQLKKAHIRYKHEIKDRLVASHLGSTNLNQPLGVLGDLGAGTGSISEALSRYTEYTVAINVVAQQLAQIARTDTRLQPIQADFHYLPFAADSFNTLLFIESFCHAAYPWQVLEQTYNLLRPQGTLFIAEPMLNQQPASELQPLVETAEKGMFTTLTHLETLALKLEELGYQVSTENITQNTRQSLTVAANSARCHEPSADPIIAGHRQAAIAYDELVKAGVMDYIFLTAKK